MYIVSVVLTMLGSAGTLWPAYEEEVASSLRRSSL